MPVVDVSQDPAATGDAAPSPLAIVSHELRTPMHGVRTIAELLLDTRLDAEQRRMVGIIRDSADMLLAQVDRMLDAARLEARRLELAPQPFAPARLVGSVVDLLRPTAEAKGLALRLDCDIPPEAWHLGDDMRVRQILLNLLGNAIKFTAAGSVTLAVTADPRGLCFVVSDTGPGLAPEQFARLFSPFRQADATTARTHGGSGLGLAICRQLAGLMGGSITVESRPGEGASFRLSLPMPQVDPPADQPAQPARPLPRQPRPAPDRAAAERGREVVLCAEDHPTSRDVLGHVLGRLGVACDVVGSGAEALRRLDRGMHGVVVTDLHMPDMDGYALARRIRAEESAHGLARLPIVALSAHLTASVRARCRAAGIDATLTKSLDLAATRALLGRWLPGLAIAEAAPGDAGTSGSASDAFDLSALIGLVGPDAAQIDPMLRDFFASASSLIGELTASAAAAEPARVIRAAHSLAGAARYVGAHRLARAAAAIEKAAGRGQMFALQALARPLERLLAQFAVAVARARGWSPGSDAAGLASR
jgi:CheY-like chemotaxis protein/anti-sigma regulatory factor (Ser/Thr protein kinase)